MDKETERFRRLLRRKGLNCRQVADKLLLHRVTVRLWHCGKEKIPPARMAQVQAMKSL